MSVATGMYMLNAGMYGNGSDGDNEKVDVAIQMLYEDRKNEFRVLSETLLSKKALESMPHWREFVLNFSLDVEDAFRTWSGESSLAPNSPQKALTLLRQLGHGKASMNELVHLLNIAYNLSLEFKEIYRRLR